MKPAIRQFMSFVFALAIIASIGIGAIGCGNNEPTAGGIVSQQIVLPPNSALVVASDTPAQDKLMAARAKQYYGARIQICDGFADDVEINAALADLMNLPSITGTLILSMGTFQIDDPIVFPGDQLTIKGSSHGASNIYAYNLSDNESAVVFNGRCVCEIEDVIIQGMQIGRTNQSCVYINSSEYIRICNNYISSSDEDGIRLDGVSSRIIIRDNLFMSMDGYGINCQGDLTFSQIEGNFIDSTTLAGVNIASASSGNNVITDNTFYNCGSGVTNNGTNTIIRDNQGWVTENSGNATVLNGSTSVEVSHGLSTTPTQVIVTPSSNPTNNVSFWYVDGINASSFTIRVNTDPGAGNLSFAWRAAAGAGN